MPQIIWETKNQLRPISAFLETDSRCYPQGAGYPATNLQNRLIHGDNLASMWALLPDYENRIELIYADPPFFTNRKYPTRVGRGEDSRRPDKWRLADGYQDHWPDLDSYLDMLYPRLALMYRLLSPTGTLYLHLDWHANSYARMLLDEIFGADRLLNEIIWVYHGPSPIRSAFNRKHDTILVYTKGSNYTFNVDDVRTPYDPSTVKTFKSSPKAGFGKVPDLKRGKVPEDWWYFPVVARLHRERTGYPTQKPEALMERIILASSNLGDIVADFFCGSGTSIAVAARSGRNFIACDSTWRAIHTTRARLVDIHAPPFELQRVRVANELVASKYDRMQYQYNPSGEINGMVFRLDQDNHRVHLDCISDDITEVDYWEVDPLWNGEEFHSVVQATRPRRYGDLQRMLNLPDQISLGKVCVRLVYVNGEELEVVISE